LGVISHSKNLSTSDILISGHQQNWGYEDGPWKRPGPSLLVAADFILFLQINPFMICSFKFAKKL